MAQQYCYNYSTNEAEVKGKTNGYVFGEGYDSGGAGLITTIDDYAKFVQAMSMGGKAPNGARILSPSTVKLMGTDRLTPQQRAAYTWKDHGYGLGVRTPLEGFPYTDFGWGGAGGTFLAVDIPNKMSLFFCEHLFNPPIAKQKSYYSAFDELHEVNPAKNSGDIIFSLY
jgi:CubicO group peptidase (beta-lactamase class C family)